MLSPEARVYVAGHSGMVGSAVCRALESAGHSDLIGWSSAEVDLTDRDAAMDAVTSAKPDVVVVAAAKVGGILANSTYPVEFLADNLRIQTNLFEAAQAADVDRLLFLGSSCIYPKMAPQPIPGPQRLVGIAEILCRPYSRRGDCTLMIPEILAIAQASLVDSRGPVRSADSGDNYDLMNAHVLPALIRRFHEAEASGAASVTLWGTGSPRREFLHVDGLATACLRLLDVYDDAEHVNVGAGSDVTIAELATLVADVVGCTGSIEWDASKPDGTPRKLLDVSRVSALGWSPAIGLREGVASTHEGCRLSA